MENETFSVRCQMDRVRSLEEDECLPDADSDRIHTSGEDSGIHTSGDDSEVNFIEIPAQTEVIEVVIEATEQEIREDILGNPAITVEVVSEDSPVNNGSGGDKGEAPYRCQQCGFSAKKKHYLKQHVDLVHTNHRPFKCPFCDYAGKRSHSLKQHLVVHSHDRPFECPDCNASFRKKAHLTGHMKLHSHHCPVCNQIMTEISKLYHHLRSEHVSQTYACPLCVFATVEAGTIIMHMHGHGNPQFFQCTACSFMAVHEKLIQVHLQTHSPTASYTLQTKWASSRPTILMRCSVCGFTTNKRKDLQAHMLNHIPAGATGEEHNNPVHQEPLGVVPVSDEPASAGKIFRCMLCGFECEEAHRLLVHAGTCRQETPAKPEEPSVGGGKPNFTHDPVTGRYRCTLCWYTCEQQRTIKGHIWKHSGHKDIDYPMFQNGPISMYDDSSAATSAPTVLTPTAQPHDILPPATKSRTLPNIISRSRRSKSADDHTVLQAWVPDDLSHLRSPSPLAVCHGPQDPPVVIPQKAVDDHVYSSIAEAGQNPSVCVKLLRNVLPASQTSHGGQVIAELNNGTKVFFMKVEPPEAPSSHGKSDQVASDAADSNADSVKVSVSSSKLASQADTSISVTSPSSSAASSEQGQKRSADSPTSSVRAVKAARLDSSAAESSSSSKLPQEVCAETYSEGVPLLSGCVEEHPSQAQPQSAEGQLEDAGRTEDSTQGLETTIMSESIEDVSEEVIIASSEDHYPCTHETPPENLYSLEQHAHSISESTCRDKAAIAVFNGANNTDPTDVKVRVRTTSATSEEMITILSLLKKGPNYNPACPNNVVRPVSDGESPGREESGIDIPDDGDSESITASSEMSSESSNRKQGICSSLLAVIEQLRERANVDAASEDGLHAGITKKSRGSMVDEEDICVDTHPGVERLATDGVEQYRCRLCHYSSTSTSLMRSHLRMHKEKLPFECSLCDYHASSSADLQAHTLRHCKVRTYPCRRCSAVFNYKSQLRAHLRAHERAPLLCRMCTYQTIDPMEYRQHLHSHTQATDKSTQLPHNHEDSQNRMVAMVQHDDSELETLYKCETCGSEASSVEQMDSHILTHLGEQSHDTDDANSNQKYLVIDNIKPKLTSLQCELCDFCAVSSRSLKSHMKRHANDARFVQHPLEQYKCRLCGYVCHHLPSLKAHMWRHASHDAYSYEHTNLIINTASSQDDDPTELTTTPHTMGNSLITFRCCQCGYETINKLELNQHMREHMNVIQQTFNIGDTDKAPRNMDLESSAVVTVPHNPTDDTPKLVALGH